MFITTDSCAKAPSGGTGWMYPFAFRPFIAAVTLMQESRPWPREKTAADAGLCNAEPATGIILYTSC